jgi:uncharacterized protein YndB with AHSA1/START domain
MIEAPVGTVWELVGNPATYDRWWPRIVHVDAEEIAPGCTYRQRIKEPFGREDTHTVEIEELEDCHVVQVRCLEPGVAMRWAVTSAGEGTFVDAAFGVEIDSLGKRVFGAIAGKRFLRRWLEDSLEALRTATERNS